MNIFKKYKNIECGLGKNLVFELTEEDDFLNLWGGKN